jgi:ATP-dependent Lon protease
MSLGGVRDESEIRGHRRTYIGSQFRAKLSKGMKKAKSFEPAFLVGRN